MSKDTLPRPDLSALEVRHKGFLHFSSGASPGQVEDSTTIIELIDAVKVLRNALGFYADEKHYDFDISWEHERTKMTGVIVEDNGKRARKALGSDR